MNSPLLIASSRAAFCFSASSGWKTLVDSLVNGLDGASYFEETRGGKIESSRSDDVSGASS